MQVASWIASGVQPAEWDDEAFKLCSHVESKNLPAILASHESDTADFRDLRLTLGPAASNNDDTISETKCVSLRGGSSSGRTWNDEIFKASRKPWTF